MPRPSLTIAPQATPGAPAVAAPGDSAHPGAPTVPAPPMPPNPFAPPSLIKPYAQVIPADAKSRVGLFTVHRVGPKLYFEIPRAALNHDLLLVGRYTAAAASPAPQQQQSYAGDQFAERTVRWERDGTRILVRSPLFAITADSTAAVYQTVAASNTAPIIAVFDIEAFGADSAAVIDVTPLYTTPVLEFSGLPPGVGLDPRRSSIDRAVAFPDNVEIEATQSGNGPTGAITVVAHWSMIRLPAQPMRPRLADSRIGYLTHSRTDFGTPAFKAVEQQYIARWRLEKKDPAAAKSDPVTPIVYYIDPATPDVWKPYVRAAVLEWQSAFEEAGFTNAIVPADPPVNDPDWSAEDVRNTVIRWLPSTTPNAQGPHIADPRTGEILNGSIRMFHNILKLTQTWYFTQVSPLDPRVQNGPMPDSLMGRLVQYVVAHEIGHTLGLTHNHKASSLYPLDSIRRASWVTRMGHTPSIMDYSRFNYVAQPEDRLPLSALIPTVGPYDRFAIMWGYAPITGMKTAQDEQPQLNQWARRQDTIPWLRFGRMAETSNGNADPGDETEAVGDADAVTATRLGMKNIQRAMKLLVPATVTRGESYDDLRDMYVQLLEQWQRELFHVTAIVGGVDAHPKNGGQPGIVYTPVSRARQEAAVRFLNAHAFATPTMLLDESVTRRFEPAGTLERVSRAQAQLLAVTLDDGKMARLLEFGLRSPQAYSPLALLTDVQNGVWSELTQPSVTIDVYRRALQTRYLETCETRVRAPMAIPGMPMLMAMTAVSGDIAATYRAAAVTLDATVARAIPRAATPETRAHLVNVRRRLRALLAPPGERS